MSIGSTIRELGVKVSLLFDKANAEAIRNSIDSVANKVRSVGIEVSGASAALLGMAAISSDNSRTLEQNAKALGINVGVLQELEYASKIAAGVSRDELGGALEGLSKTLFDVRNNSPEAAQTLLRLGVPLELINNKSTTSVDLMLRLADSFKHMPDGIYKTTLATQAFGGAGAKLLPLLSKGSEGIRAYALDARKSGVVLNEAFIKQGAEFDRQLSKIWIILKNISFVLGGQLIKYLYPMVLQFQKFITANREFIALGTATVFKSLGTYLQIVFSLLNLLTNATKKLVSALGGVEKVSKLIAIGFAVFTSYKIVAAVTSLLSILTLVSPQLMLIAAGFSALAFSITDLFSNNSVIKEGFSKFIEGLKGITFSNTLAAAFDTITTAVNDSIKAFEILFGWIGKIFSAVSTPIGNLILGGMDKIQSALGLSTSIGKDTVIPSARSSSSSSAETTNNMSATINVSVPIGTTATQATDIVDNATQNAFKQMLDDQLRHTRNAAIGGVSH